MTDRARALAQTFLDEWLGGDWRTVFSDLDQDAATQAMRTALEQQEEQ